ncbi:hypothetical protein [Peribacillus frigoritolerans]|uniref:hypothetical protein n=1 Tax=Peribacillus frigoritolerans TaxID=450367 RepID=UPI003CFFADB9
MIELLFNLFDIQHSPANIDNFKIAFWSGLLYSLIIGILVALFTLYMERRVSKKITESQYEKETAVFLGKVTTLLRLPIVTIENSNAEDWLPANYKELILLITDNPIHVWESEGKKKYQEMLKKCDNISSKYQDFLVASKSLTLVLHLRIQGDTSTSIRDAIPILGLINDFEVYKAKLKTSPSAEMPLPIKVIYNEIIEIEEVKEYKEKRQELLGELNKFKLNLTQGNNN